MNFKRIFSESEDESPRKRIRLQTGEPQSQLPVQLPDQLSDQLPDQLPVQLPDQVVIKILSYMSMSDLVLRLSLVSKRWNTLSEAPELWRRIDLSNQSKLTTANVEDLLCRSNAVVHINLTNCSNIPGSVISRALERTNLRSLILEGCWQFAFTQFHFISQNKSLTKLNVNGVHQLNDKTLVEIAQSCKNLISLDIGNTYITEIGLQAVLKNCLGMKYLKMSGCTQVSGKIMMALPVQLQTLDISRCQYSPKRLRCLAQLTNLEFLNASINFDMGNSVVPVLSNLKELVLKGCPYISLAGVSAIVEKNPNLVKLSVAGYHLKDDALKRISESHCRFTLKTLVIESDRVTKVGINYILQGCKRLTSLTIPPIFSNKLVRRWRRMYSRIKIAQHCYWQDWMSG